MSQERFDDLTWEVYSNTHEPFSAVEMSEYSGISEEEAGERLVRLERKGKIKVVGSDPIGTPYYVITAEAPYRGTFDRRERGRGRFSGKYWERSSVPGFDEY